MLLDDRVRALPAAPAVRPDGPASDRTGSLTSASRLDALRGAVRTALAGDAPDPRPDQPPGGADADSAAALRIVGLVDLARAGDADAFGELYDHYHAAVYRFVYHRVGSVPLAEDLVSETFFRALRGMRGFTWQGRDFGAWLTTIARNLVIDHYKAGRTRWEQTCEDMSPHDVATVGPDVEVLMALTSRALLAAVRNLPAEQQECVVMRFLQGLSIAETAAALGRSTGAVKQLQLRGVRNLAKALPDGVR